MNIEERIRELLSGAQSLASGLADYRSRLPFPEMPDNWKPTPISPDFSTEQFNPSNTYGRHIYLGPSSPLTPEELGEVDRFAEQVAMRDFRPVRSWSIPTPGGGRRKASWGELIGINNDRLQGRVESEQGRVQRRHSYARQSRGEFQRDQAFERKTATEGNAASAGRVASGTARGNDDLSAVHHLVDGGMSWQDASSAVMGFKPMPAVPPPKPPPSAVDKFHSAWKH